MIADRELTGPIPEQVQSRVLALFTQILGLSQRDREVIGSAIELHSAVVQLLPVDLNAAYALCVAGLEALATAYGSTDTTWAQWEQATRFDGVFNAAQLSEAQKDAMRAALLDGRHLGLRQRFASYVSSQLPSTFWDENIETFTPSLVIQPDGTSAFVEPAPGNDLPVARFVPSDEVALRRRLLATYDARSTYVHAGGRAVSFGTALSAAVGDDASPKTPIDLVGLRRILLTLIRRELAERCVEVELPEILVNRKDS